jgi:glyoxylase-like metal-dependent hydrolase (beta-lactamase superfamily II)
MMYGFRGLFTLLLFLPVALTAGCTTLTEGPKMGLRVHTFASPDPDSVNSYAVETSEGLVVISAQRTKSEATRAAAFLTRLNKPVVAIAIPVAHTDHYGGLSTLRRVFPQAKVYASEKTIFSMRTDGEGYIASRKKALGDDFPSQDEVNQNLPNSVLRDGQQLTFGDISFDVIDLPDNNAPTNTLLHEKRSGSLFSSELIENSVTAFMKDANLDTWLHQITQVSRSFPSLQTVYGAHGRNGPADVLIGQQVKYLTQFRDLVDAELRTSGLPNEARRTALAQQFDSDYPHYAQVARLPRAQLIALNLQWQSEKRAKR